MTRIQPSTSTSPAKKPRKSHVKNRPLTKAQRIRRMNKLEGIDKEVKKDKERFFRQVPKEAKFWEARSSFSQQGRPPIFETHQQLFKACMEYIEWVHDNPFYEYKVCGTHFGEPVIDYIPKKRPLTLGGLLIFLNISAMTWGEYRKNKGEGFSYVTEVIDEMIKYQKFTGAAAGFFNTQIIARDLGLVDRQDITTGGDKLQNQSVVVLPSKEEIPA